ncbi:MAG TPA: hypothetical protein VFG04_29650 [Planctomycetaceae bacterium]|jgi:hypothetical protein|nr:hypothetical protein [Planctomycetaceae bacterium]
MLESTQMAQTGLELGLAELQAFGLIRPSNVLLAEYLRALTAERVLDAATAEQVSAAYNRIHYSAVSDDDPQVRDAIAALDRVADDVAAMTSQNRKDLARRLANRLPSVPAESLLERDTEFLLDGCETPLPPTRKNRTRAQTQATQQHKSVAASSERNLTTPRSPATRDPLAAPTLTASRRRSLLPRVSLAFAILAALATFFGGYFFHETGNATAEVSDVPLPVHGPAHAASRNVWQDAKLWLDGLRSRAEEAARSQQYAKARLALELILAYAPDNPSALNDLATIHLKPNADGASDPKRALQLIQRAMELNREPAILDTAAEAQFQCGNVREAIRLEGESMANAFEPDDENDEFRTYRLQQLQKFQEAAQIRTAERAPTAPKETSTADSSSAKSGADAPIASGRSKSTGNVKGHRGWRLQLPVNGRNGLGVS